VILSGINMPGMDGLELLRKIQAAAIRSRSNRVSPYGVTSGAGGTGEYGPAEFVTKPADFEIVKTQLRQLSTAADQEARRSLE
jgi:YesN/AraC family two-component response regulator